MQIFTNQQILDHLGRKWHNNADPDDTEHQLMTIMELLLRHKIRAGQPYRVLTPFVSITDETSETLIKHGYTHGQSPKHNRIVVGYANHTCQLE